MKKIIFILIVIMSIFIGILLTRFIIGGDEDTWICKNGNWVKHGNPKTLPQGNCIKSE